jgi:hypothetical protein
MHLRYIAVVALLGRSFVISLPQGYRIMIIVMRLRGSSARKYCGPISDSSLRNLPRIRFLYDHILALVLSKLSTHNRLDFANPSLLFTYRDKVTE